MKALHRNPFAELHDMFSIVLQGQQKMERYYLNFMLQRDRSACKESLQVKQYPFQEN